MLVWISLSLESSLTSCLIALLTTLLMGYAIDRKRRGTRRKKYNLPPGPTGVPILGTFPAFLKAPAPLVFQEWTKQYGSIYKFSLGTGTSVVLGDANIIREAFIDKSPDVDSRCQWRYCFIKMFRGLSVLPYSVKWVNTRRKTISILRNLGMGKSSMEETIYQESINLVECMMKVGENGRRNVNPRNMLRRSPMNVLCSILFGNRYNHQHPGLLYVMNTVVSLVDFLAKASVYDILPTYLRNLAGFSLKSFHKQLNDLNQFMRDRINEHKKEFNKKKTSNFIDAWLKTEDSSHVDINQQFFPLSPSGGSKLSHCSELSDVLQDVVIAGAHSTGVVFNWAVLLLVLHKPVQDKAYEEIMEVIGPDRPPGFADKPKLRYIEAVMNEILRIATILPLVAHATWRDTTLGGFDVPANIEVIYNNWALNRDEKVFPNPDKFDPSRWLLNGVIRKELFHGFFPFGIGKRSCAGEALARMNLFITITTLLQKVELLHPDETVPSAQQPKLIHQFALLAECKPYEIRARRRISPE